MKNEIHDKVGLIFLWYVGIESEEFCICCVVFVQMCYLISSRLTLNINVE